MPDSSQGWGLRGRGLVWCGLLLLPTMAPASAHEGEVQRLRIELDHRETSSVTLPWVPADLAAAFEDVQVTTSVDATARVYGSQEADAWIRWSSDPELSHPDVTHHLDLASTDTLLGMEVDLELTVVFTATLDGVPITFAAVGRTSLVDEVEGFQAGLLPYSPGETGVLLQPSSPAVTVPLFVQPTPEAAPYTVQGSLEAQIMPTLEAAVYGEVLDTVFPWTRFREPFQTDGAELGRDGQYVLPTTLWEVREALPVQHSWRATLGQQVSVQVALSGDLSVSYAGFSLPLELEQPAMWFSALPYWEQRLDVEGDGVAHPLPVLSLRSDEVSFPSATVGTPETLHVPIDNLGEFPLSVDASLQTDGSTVFALDDTSTLEVDARGTGLIPVTLSPAEAGEHRALLILNTNDPFRPVVEVPLVISADVPGPSSDPDGFAPLAPSADCEAGECACACQSVASPGHALAWAFLPGLAAFIRRRR